jgi:hypothetical protein
MVSLHWSGRILKNIFSDLADLANGGDDGDRTHDLRLAKPALYQLSYVPGEFQPTKSLYSGS